MNVKDVSEIMKNVQLNLLNFLDKDYDVEENFQILKAIFDEQDFQNKKYFLNSLFHLITEISNNHNRSANFYEKIERVLDYFKNSIKQNYSNSQIFNIFQSNKRLILYFLEEKLLIFNDYIINKITTDKSFKKMKYTRYFYPELKQFLKFEKNTQKEGEETKKTFTKRKKTYKRSFNYNSNKDEESSSSFEDEYSDNEEDDLNEEEVNDDFYTNRKIGENHHYICTLIRKDLIEDFIIYVEKNNYSLTSKIKPSIYETNSFLQERKKVTLIKYASFFGSTQIFNYLRLNQVKLNSKLWMYAIHSNSSELYSLLEENHVKIKNTYLTYFNESIKCHHIDFTNYFLSNHLQDYKDNQFNYRTTIEALKYHNFTFINSFYISQSSFYYLCYYDYSFFVHLLFDSLYIDVNHVIKDFSDEKVFYMPALHIAINEENIDIVKLLLTRNEIDINMKDNDQTAFYLALEKNNNEIIKLLLENDNLNINEISMIEREEKTYYYRKNTIREEKTAFFKAVEEENIELIKLLLNNKKLDVNILNKDGKGSKQTALYKAVEKENIEIIKLILSNENLDINIINITHEENAVEEDNNNGKNSNEEKDTEEEEEIDENEETDNYEDVYKDPYKIHKKTAFYLAIEKGNIEIIKLLLSNENLDVNILNTIRFIKSYYNEEEICEPDCYEYSSGSRYTTYQDVHETVKYTSKTALCLAVDKGNIEIINLLLANNKLDINILNSSGIDKARKEVYHRAGLINECNANIASLKYTTLYEAVTKGNIEIIKVLLSNDKIDVNILAKESHSKKKEPKNRWSNEWKWELESEDERTVLHLAVENDNYEITKLLLQVKNIDTEAIDKKGNNPFYYVKKDSKINELFKH